MFIINIHRNKLIFLHDSTENMNTKCEILCNRKYSGFPSRMQQTAHLPYFILVLFITFFSNESVIFESLCMYISCICINR